MLFELLLWILQEASTEAAAKQFAAYRSCFRWNLSSLLGGFWLCNDGGEALKLFFSVNMFYPRPTFTQVHLVFPRLWVRQRTLWTLCSVLVLACSPLYPLFSVASLVSIWLKTHQRSFKLLTLQTYSPARICSWYTICLTTASLSSNPHERRSPLQQLIAAVWRNLLNITLGHSHDGNKGLEVSSAASEISVTTLCLIL